MTRGMQELSASFVVAAVGATWGCWWIFLRLIEAEGISPGWTLAVVYGAAAIALIPLFACRWRHWRAMLWPVIAVGVAYAMPLAFWSHAVIHGSVVRVTLLFYLTPVWGTLLAVAAFRERLTSLRAQLHSLGATWRDQEHKKFTEDFEEHMKVIARYVEVTNEHAPFLLRKAERIEEYLQQR